MRAEIRARLIDQIPQVGERVFEPHMGSAATPKPFLVVKQSPQDAGEPWGDLSTPVEVWPYVDLAAFGAVDELAREIVGALDRHRLEDAAGSQFLAVYAGEAGADFRDDLWQALTRPVRFRVFSLGWLAGLTFEPDPVSALRAWTAAALGVSASLSLDDTDGLQVVALTSRLPAGAGNALSVSIQEGEEGEAASVVVKQSGTVVESYELDPQGKDDEVDALVAALEDSNLLAAARLATGTGLLAVVADQALAGGAPYVDPAAWNPTDGSPAIYWRLAAERSVEQLNWGTWLDVSLRAHVVAPSPATRLAWMRRLAEQLSVQGRIALSDGSPLLLDRPALDPTADPMRVGQVTLPARLGVLRPAASWTILARATLEGAIEPVEVGDGDEEES